MKNKLLIAVTPEHIAADECLEIESILKSGWHRVHLRHPRASRAEIRQLIERVDCRLHDRLVLHNHFDLAGDFNIGGLHLNRRCPNPPSWYNGAISRSCHSVDEVLGIDDMEYVTISPIFDSISKAGYNGAFSSTQLYGLDCSKVPVIAMGGIDREHIKSLELYNFNGYAMLGAIPWEDSTDKVTEFAVDIHKYVHSL